jgi:hypothetical protein
MRGHVFEMNMQVRRLLAALASFALAYALARSAAAQTMPVPVTIQTGNGHYLTAVNAGGLSSSEPLRTDATTAGTWETFTLVRQSGTIANGTYVLFTANGHLVSAVNGGGIGGANDGTSPVHTDAVTAGSWEKWQLNVPAGLGVPPSVQVTISTPDGRHFLTANGGGGFGATRYDVSNRITPPVVTSVTTLTSSEVFHIVAIPPPAAAPGPGNVSVFADFPFTGTLIQSNPNGIQQNSCVGNAGSVTVTGKLVTAAASNATGATCFSSTPQSGCVTVLVSAVTAACASSVATSYWSASFQAQGLQAGVWSITAQWSDGTHSSTASCASATVVAGQGASETLSAPGGAPLQVCR